MRRKHQFVERIKKSTERVRSRHSLDQGTDSSSQKCERIVSFCVPNTLKETSKVGTVPAGLRLVSIKDETFGTGKTGEGLEGRRVPPTDVPDNFTTETVLVEIEPFSAGEDDGPEGALVEKGKDVL